MTKITTLLRVITSLFVLVFTCLNNTQANTLKVTSWNIEWLSAQNVNNPYAVNRNESDIAVLKHYLSQVSPDILAFQEVDSIEAIRQLLGDDTQVYLSQRASDHFAHRQFDDFNQYTGIAAKKTISVENVDDLILTPRTKDKLRFATYVVVHAHSADITSTNTLPIHILSVHLKAGCSGKRNSSKSCKTLQTQGEKLNQWMVERTRNNDLFIVAGDFNHNLSYPNDWLYNQLTATLKNEIRLTSKKTQANCLVRSNNNPEKTHQFRSVIDHIIVSKNITSGTAIQQLFTKEDVLRYELSDHCPISVTVQLD